MSDLEIVLHFAHLVQKMYRRHYFNFTQTLRLKCLIIWRQQIQIFFTDDRDVDDQGQSGSQQPTVNPGAAASTASAAMPPPSTPHVYAHPTRSSTKSSTATSSQPQSTSPFGTTGQGQ